MEADVEKDDWSVVIQLVSGRAHLNQDGWVLGSILEASHYAGPSEYKQLERFRTGCHRGMYDASFLGSLQPSRGEGSQCSTLASSWSWQVYSKQSKSTNYIYFWNIFFFISQINTVFPSNHLMRGREGNGKVEHAVCTKVTLKMVAWSRQCTRAKDTQPLVLGGGVIENKPKIASVFATHWREPKHLLLKIIFKTSRWHRPQREKWGRDFTCLISG